MKKIVLIVTAALVVVGCATTKEVQTVNANTGLIAEAYNRLLNCMDESGKEFGKVIPCVRAKLAPTPTPTPTATQIKLAAK